MEFDTDVNNYTDQELLDLLEITDSKEIPPVIQENIDKYKNKPELVKFYIDIRDRFEAKAITDNENKKGLLSSQHLNNMVSRIVNIDSTYREYASVYADDSNDYLFKLNEPIPNVVSIMLYSIEIPMSWYTFTEARGNTVMQPVLITQNADSSLVSKFVYPFIQINDGNYTAKSLIKLVKQLIQQCGMFVNQATTFELTQDIYTGRSKIVISSAFRMDAIVLPPEPYYVGASTLDSRYTQCQVAFLFHSVELKTKVNYNLGWLLGFRVPFLVSPVLYSTQMIDMLIYSNSIVDTNGTKYIILQLDDFKTNRLNKSVVNINTKSDQVIPLPAYYNRSLPQYQTSTTTVNVTSNTIGLTEKQIYTINSISNSYNTDITAIQVTFPNISDIFAKIPIKNCIEWGSMDVCGDYCLYDNGPGKIMMEFSGPLQLATRDYFGPVDITTLQVSLYDDKGFPLGLNGLDWSFTLIAKSLINVN